MKEAFSGENQEPCDERDSGRRCRSCEGNGPARCGACFAVCSRVPVLQGSMSHVLVNPMHGRLDRRRQHDERSDDKEYVVHGNGRDRSPDRSAMPRFAFRVLGAFSFVS